MSKEYNRFQSDKALRKARNIVKRWQITDPRVADRIAHRLRDNRKQCSCEMCRNPRRSKWAKKNCKLTIHERRANTDVSGD